ncbi:unnamed protein product [Phaedon cochleariae]|uniref:MADF domain-containing protein n=1 Tax=Phaedon cochleariae TaxID=80249 RepID=A0A9N9SBE0_PHACE|nr:unnamed protein product [Phaedon cochleariae]
MQNFEELRLQTDQAIPLNSTSKTDIDKTLITLVKKMYPIWDRTCNNYPNKQLKNQLWENIGTQLNLDKNACMLRWKSLREKYIRQKVKYHQDGEKWELLDELSFLDRVIQFRKKLSDHDHNPKDPFLDNLQTSKHFPTYPKHSDTSHFPQETDSSFSQLHYSYETADDSSMNDSSNDYMVQVKSENTTIEVPDSSFSSKSSPRKRGGSVNSEVFSEKKSKTEVPGRSASPRSPEELFGELVGAMLSRKPECDRNRYMIEIMTVLSK